MEYYNDIYNRLKAQQLKTKMDAQQVRVDAIKQEPRPSERVMSNGVRVKLPAFTKLDGMVLFQLMTLEALKGVK